MELRRRTACSPCALKRCPLADLDCLAPARVSKISDKAERTAQAAVTFRQSKPNLTRRDAPVGRWAEEFTMEQKRDKEAAEETATHVRHTLKGAADTAKDEAVAAADRAKREGGDRMAGVGHAVHGAADELGRELPQIASYIHSAAEKLESTSSALRERSVEELMSDFNGFARRQPAAAFAGSVLAGFALSRLLKSSAARGENRR
jgi:hypothetical protein